ncbi:MAG: hypothetical protein EA377_00060, partial [Phycisphaerales bacterium]
FAAWRLGDAARREAFTTGTRLGKLYWGWVQLLRYIVPIAVLIVFLNAIGIIEFGSAEDETAETPELIEEVHDEGNGEPLREPN